jgi:membrane associated rhomboid family serine protease
VKRLRIDFPWTAGVALLALAVSLSSFAGGPAGSFVETHLLASGAALREPWRLVTGPFVHSSIGQLLRDVIGFVILGAAYEAELGRRFARLLLPALVLPAAAELVARPGAQAYYGLSGAVYALLALAVVREWRRAEGKPPTLLVRAKRAEVPAGSRPTFIVVLAVVSGAKLVYETITGHLLIPMELGDGVHPATWAHFAGVLIGVLGSGDPDRTTDPFRTTAASRNSA